MPRPRRVAPPGLIFHVVNRAAKRVPLFEDSGDYRAFEQIVRAALVRFDVALFAYCLMPNHWHFLLSPRGDGALPRFMHWLTTTHARRWQTSRGMDGYGAVYQGRYKAIAVGTDRYLWVCRYIERNALRARLVARAEQWRWSSLFQRLRSDDVAWLASWPVQQPDDWIAHVNVPQTDAELEAFRRAMRIGDVFGSDEWRDAVAATLGVNTRGKRGRPSRRVARTVLEK